MVKRIYGASVALVLLLGCLVAAVALSGNAHAANGALSLTTSPLPVNLVVAPGNTASTDLRIKNSGVKTELIKIKLMKFEAFGEDGKPKIEDRGPGDDYFDWVRFSESTFTLEPNIWKTIKMNIAVPKSAAFGYYYAVSFERATEGVTSKDRQTTLQGAPATLVLLEARVPGAKRQLDVVEFSTDHKLYEFLPTTFRIKLRNKGNVHVAPSGSIFISKNKSKSDGIVSINQERGNILPASNRQFSAKWADGTPVYQFKESNGEVVLDSRGKSKSVLNWDGLSLNKLRFGHYTATLTMAYNDGTRDVPVEAEVGFWVIPWRIIFGVILLIVIPSTLAYWIAKWRLKRSSGKRK